MHNLLIIGGGPAALSAASYALGKQLGVALVYEDLGGKVGWLQSLADVDEERRLPGNEVVRLLTARTVHANSTVIKDRAVAVSRHADHFVVTTANAATLQAESVIIATGATPVRLRVPGAERLVRHGLGYSIRTFGHLVAGKRVAVIGATARALRGAAELTRLARHVTLVAPGDSDDGSLIAALRQRPNVSVYAGYDVSEIVGAVAVAGMRIARGAETHLLDVDHVFVDLGLVPDSELVRGLVETDAQGFIVVDQHKATATLGLFAAGDVTADPGEQVLIAVGAGAQAALSAYDYLLERWLDSEQDMVAAPRDDPQPLHNPVLDHS